MMRGWMSGVMAAIVCCGCGTQHSIRERVTGLEDERSDADTEGIPSSVMAAVPARLAPVRSYCQSGGSEEYDPPADNPFRAVSRRGNDVSTFALEVDTASYANVRRMVMSEGRLPPAGAVRIEEMVNYFTYDAPAPGSSAASPFAVHTEVGNCPWNPGNRLLRICLQGKQIGAQRCPVSNLVFLIDVSGSMADANKLPLLQYGLRQMIAGLQPNDRVAIVTYAGASGVVLPSTAAADGKTLLRALEHLQAGGSTNGGAGITLAYQVARENFWRGGNNRVVLCTDGDFNVGITERSSLTALIEREAGAGVALTVLGFGMGNYKDATMEALSQHGRGSYFYIDTEQEARKVLGQQLTGTLVTIAQDVKAQVFLNPARVKFWKLIGYENRQLPAAAFNDDRKPASGIGAGHCVTALYELTITPPARLGAVDANPFCTSNTIAAAAEQDALLRLRLRYKLPGAKDSTLQEFDVRDPGAAADEVSTDFRWAAAVAWYGLLLRREGIGRADWSALSELARGAAAGGRRAERSEFLTLLRTAGCLATRF